MTHRLLALFVLLSTAALPSTTSAESPARHHAEIDGIAVDVSLQPVTAASAPRPDDPLRVGDVVRLRVELHDTASESPLAGAWPAAWLDWLPPGEASSATEAPACVDKVEELIAGSLLSQATVDFNVFHVVALNDDATLTVLDPRFGFGGSRLLALVELASPGEDWALLDRWGRLFVSQPEAGRIAVVRTDDWTVERQLGESETLQAPRRVALQPDGERLWVVEDGGLVVYDTETLKAVARVELTGRPEELAWSGDGDQVFVTLREADAVAVLDAHRPRLSRIVATGDAPSALAWSSRAEALYVAHEGDGTIVVLDAESPEVLARMQAEPGLTALRFAPGERFALVLNPDHDLLHVVDVAWDRIVQSGPMAGGPDQVTFTDTLAYVRHRDSDTVLMLPLDLIGREGEPFQAVDFTGGKAPFGAGTPSLAAGMVRAPGANAMVIGNPADEVIYYYVEGMAAPMGELANHDRQPRAVLVADRSLRERRPGVYETTARLERAGSHDLAVFLDAPRLVHCFRIEVAEAPEAERTQPPPRVRFLPKSSGGREHDGLTLTVLVEEGVTGTPIVGIDDLTLLLFQPAGAWQRRERAEEVGDGIYRASFAMPGLGPSLLFAESPSRDISITRRVAAFGLREGP
ncbi:MAG: YncE family protein [Acidobacteriota bacterium]